MAALAMQGSNMNDRDTVFYSLFAGEEVSEGPLSPESYAQTDAPGIGGTRVGALEAEMGLDVISFEDPEVEFSAALFGNAIIAPLTPIAADPENPAPPSSAVKPRIYTVQSGDTLSTIAEAHNVSSATIQATNGLSTSDIIKPGDNLTILPFDGLIHTVKSGDTVSSLANKYDAESNKIVEQNNLGENAKLSIGQQLIIPDGKMPTPIARHIPTASSEEPSTTPDASEEPKPSDAPIDGKGWLWPTSTKHISQYFRWGHTGVDIDNRSRPAIYAALNGTVDYAGWLGGYGNLLILNHGNGVQTYYGHLQKMYVGKGESITKGEAIAQMGSTGRSTGPHLHFEVRRNGRPINPMGMF